MGDNLPELLYEAFRGSYNAQHDPELPPWREVEAHEQAHWEQVAVAARADAAAKQNDEIEMLRGAIEGWRRVHSELKQAARELADASDHCRSCAECGDGPCCANCCAEAKSQAVGALLDPPEYGEGWHGFP